MFEKQPISPSSLLTQLVAGVKEGVKSLYSRGENTIWTLSVKETLKAIGEAPPLNFECIYTDRQAGTSEFVLDLVWWDRDSGEGAALALECEWFYERISRGEAQYAEFVSNDFWKPGAPGLDFKTWDWVKQIPPDSWPSCMPVPILPACLLSLCFRYRMRRFSS